MNDVLVDAIVQGEHNPFHTYETPRISRDGAE